MQLFQPLPFPYSISLSFSLIRFPFWLLGTCLFRLQFQVFFFHFLFIKLSSCNFIYDMFDWVSSRSSLLSALQILALNSSLCGTCGRQCGMLINCIAACHILFMLPHDSIAAIYSIWLLCSVINWR